MIRRAAWLAQIVAAMGLLASAPAAAAPVGQAVTPTVAPVATPGKLPDARAGLSLFAERCAACHGPQGRGDGEMLADLPGRRAGRPISFADPDYMRAVVPAASYDVVTRGRIDLGMPPWSEALTATERWDALYGAWSHYFTPERLVRGREAWMASCADCHGPDGRGVAEAPLADASYMVTRSQADLYSGTRSAPTGHENLAAVADETLWSALDYARGFTFGGSPTADLALGGRIAGRLVPGTAGAGAPQGASVRLVPLGDLAPGRPMTATVGADGAFAFDDLVVGPGAEYALVTGYKGVDALTQETIELPAAAPRVAGLALPVHEPATDVQVSVRTGHLVLAPDPENGVVRVAEVWVIQNATDRVLVAPEGGATVRLPLPPGLEEVRLEDDRMRQADRMDGDTLVDTVPVPPGERQIVVSYDLPYEGTTADVDRVVPLDTDELRVMVTGAGVGLASAVLGEQGSTTVQGEPVLQAVGRGLRAGEAVPIRLTGLPPAADVAPGAMGMVAGKAVDQRALAWLAVLLTLFGLAVVLLYPGVARGRSGGVGARLAVERARLVGEMATLDRARAAGQVAPVDYEARRARLMNSALAVARQQCALKGDGA